MSLGMGFFLLLVGAILKYVITIDRVEFVDLKALGGILMIAGVVVIVLSLLWLAFSSVRTRRRAGPHV
jgi:hypothetical protein